MNYTVSVFIWILNHYIWFDPYFQPVFWLFPTIYIININITLTFFSQRFVFDTMLHLQSLLTNLAESRGSAHAEADAGRNEVPLAETDVLACLQQHKSIRS